jgi:hypothetical protein
MKAAHLVALLALAVGVLALVLWRGSPRSEVAERHAASSADPLAPRDATGEATRAPDAPPTAAQPAAVRAADPHTTRNDEHPTRTDADWPITWPVARSSAAAAGRANAAGPAEPSVPVRIAFRALWYLGVDPAAESTWSRAINDPSLPDGVRSDLIVDMIDEGYTDNSRPTAADLPTILARLEIVERHAPHAMDDVNRDAFEEAYRHLLDMYVRLGGRAVTTR